VQPLGYHGHDIVIFQLLDPNEKAPEALTKAGEGKGRESLMLEDMETKSTVQVSAQYLRETYNQRLENHLAELKRATASLGAHHVSLVTDEPLDRALRQYLKFREGRG